MTFPNLIFFWCLEPAVFLAVSQFFSNCLEPAVFPAVSQIFLSVRNLPCFRVSMKLISYALKVIS